MNTLQSPPLTKSLVIPVLSAAPAEVLATRLAPPRLPSSRVHRPALLARLDAGLERPLTLISAPAGFGKTTLAGEWLERLTNSKDERLVSQPANFSATFQSSNQQSSMDYAWLSLDAGDNDPLRFWRHLFTAARALDPQAAATALELLEVSQEPHFEAPLTALINALAELRAKCVLILEDAHLLANPQILGGLDFLVDHLPPTLHMVLLARSDPPLPSLPRLRARNALNELRLSDLRFSEAEAGEFLRLALTRPLSPEALHRLFVRTEGWPAGLRLAALALQGRPQAEDQEQFLDTLSGGHRPILEFLLADVLACQDETTQQFILETSFLDRLNASLCAAVTGRAGCAGLLERLERGNLFLEPLDGAGEWYRYHALFSEAMQVVARQRLGLARLRRLSLRASGWYAGHGMLPHAVEAALSARDFTLAADLAEQAVVPRLAGNEYHTLARWLQQLPEEALRGRPRLCLVFAQALLFTSKSGQAVPAARLRALLELAEQAWTAQGSLPQLGELLAFRALASWRLGDFAQAFIYARQALAYLSPDDSAAGPAAQDPEWRALSLLFVGWEEYFSGHLEAALPLLAEARRLYQASGSVYGRLDALHALAEVHARRAESRQALELYRLAQDEIERAPIDRFDRLKRLARGLVGLASLAYERNDLPAAAQDAARALDLARELDGEELAVQASCVLARLERARGEIDAARRRLDALAVQVRQPLFLRQVRLGQVWLALSAGDLSAAGPESSPLSSASLPRIFQEQEALLEARACLARGRPQDALPLLEYWLEDARRHARLRSELEIHLLAALTQAALDRLPEARQSLSSALRLAPPESFLRLYLDEGLPLLALLQSLLADPAGDLPAGRLHSLLAAYAPEPPASPPISELHPATLPPPLPRTPGDLLTFQEERVLRLLAAGHSNQEMAQDLVISVNTVKTHIKSIYRKLGANNRRSARQAARQLQLS